MCHYDVGMTENAASWLDSLAARDEEFRASIAPVSADHVGDLSVAELQARLIAAAEGNSLRDAIIQSQSARIADLSAKLADLSAKLAQARSTPNPASAISSSLTPLRRVARIGAAAARRGRRVLRRVVDRVAS